MCLSTCMYGCTSMVPLAPLARASGACGLKRIRFFLPLLSQMKPEPFASDDGVPRRHTGVAHIYSEGDFREHHILLATNATHHTRVIIGPCWLPKADLWSLAQLDLRPVALGAAPPLAPRNTNMSVTGAKGRGGERTLARGWCHKAIPTTLL